MGLIYSSQIMRPISVRNFSILIVLALLAATSHALPMKKKPKSDSSIPATVLFDDQSSSEDADGMLPMGLVLHRHCSYSDEQEEVSSHGVL
jgi:hypothetical protein